MYLLEADHINIFHMQSLCKRNLLVVVWVSEDDDAREGKEGGEGCSMMADIANTVSELTLKTGTPVGQ